MTLRGFFDLVFVGIKGYLIIIILYFGLMVYLLRNVKKRSLKKLFLFYMIVMILFFVYEFFNPDISMLQSVLIFFLVGQVIQLNMILKQIDEYIPAGKISILTAINNLHFALLILLEFLSSLLSWDTCSTT